MASDHFSVVPVLKIATDDRCIVSQAITYQKFKVISMKRCIVSQAKQCQCPLLSRFDFHAKLVNK